VRVSDLTQGLDLIHRTLRGGKLLHIGVRPAPGEPQRGILTGPGFRLPTAIGRSGIGREKIEGDGKTPSGTFRLLSVLYRPDRGPKPLTALPVSPLGPDLGWCDDPDDRSYNRPVRLPYRGRHERLWRDDHRYDIVVVLDFNFARPRPGGGSAIFIHVAGPGLTPTEGCIALSERDLRRLLGRVGPRTRFAVGQNARPIRAGAGARQR
jgi:L,D-peptidoglycan transpeptidase YkuD (ErfK/YbiS/YcfS/YnhG family)